MRIISVLKLVANYLKNFFQNTKIQLHVGLKNTEIYVIFPSRQAVSVAFFLKNHGLFNFEQLIEIAVVDNLSSLSARFSVKYLLLSSRFSQRLTLHGLDATGHTIFSLINLYKSAE
jgi:NADH:ubiquinone oxidoreductase subunit C